MSYAPNIKKIGILSNALLHIFLRYFFKNNLHMKTEERYKTNSFILRLSKVASFSEAPNDEHVSIEQEDLS